GENPCRGDGTAGRDSNPLQDRLGMRSPVADRRRLQSRGAKSSGDRSLPGRQAHARAHRGVTRSTRWGRIGRAAGLTLVLVLIASAAEAQSCPKGTLRFYTSWAMQGGMAAEGVGMKNGLDMAVAEVGGAVAGYCLEVVNLDNASAQTGKWDEALEAENARKAVSDPKAMVFIGPYNSGAAMVSARITNRALMAQVTPGATYPGLTKKVDGRPGEPFTYRPLALINFFRPLPADDVQGEAGARWAKRLDVK